MSPIVLNTVATICFVAGKSGGHLLPCITKAYQIKKENPQTELYLFSTGSELDKKIIDKHSILTHYIPIALRDVPYQQPWFAPLFMANASWYFCKSLYKLYSTKTNKVISFGGFNSIPVCLAAKALGIPFEVYELNIEPGKATKFLSYFTQTIYTCFKQTQKYFPNNTCIQFDYPVRFNESDKQFDKEAFFKKYKFSNDRKTILILGGSQGSTLLNEIFTKMIQEYPELCSKIQVIHQTGGSSSAIYEIFYKNLHIPAIVFGYHEQLQNFYNAADLIISRAGAGSLFEIKFFEKPCICIPHETANTNHQIQNVLALQQEYPDQFTIIKQSDFDHSKLHTTLLQMKCIKFSS